MTWTYFQSTGKLAHDDADVATGYSGAAEGKNNPDMQEIHNIGPIPCGGYTINAPQDTVTHGPYVLPLTPFPSNEMFERAGFLMHGDSVVHPGTASEGCIIMPRPARERVWKSGDRRLMVEA